MTLRWKPSIVLVFLVVLLAALLVDGETAFAATSGPSASPSLSIPVGSPLACPSANRVLSGVWGPSRLTVLNPCQLVSGTVTKVEREQDGDAHIQLAVDPPYQGLLNNVNRQSLGGDLLVEFMPRDGGHLLLPSVGNRLVLRGVWVNDTEHGWNELHPVFSESINGGPAFVSGPQFGGDPPQSTSESAAADCRTNTGAVCTGYPAPEGVAPAADFE